MVDAKHQVVVHGEAYGEGNEQHLLRPMIEGTREVFEAIGSADVFIRRQSLQQMQGSTRERTWSMCLKRE